jgi:hypothetical protein
VAKALGIALHGDPGEMIAEGAGKPGKRKVFWPSGQRKLTL